LQKIKKANPKISKKLSEKYQNKINKTTLLLLKKQNSKNAKQNIIIKF
jgi:hypothetical protein